jgi:Domain of unknown function (DUF4249)
MVKYIFLSLFLLFVFTSCEDQFTTTLNVDPPEHTPQMAVHAYLMDDYDFIGVSVVQSYGILENGQSEEEQYLEGATVEIYQQGQLKYTVPALSEILPPDQSVWFLPINYGLELDEPVGGLGDSFEIKVSHPEFGTVTGVQYMPAMHVQVSEAKFEKDGGFDDEGEKINAINITFMDQPEVDNYYEVLVAARFDNGNGQITYYPIDLMTSTPDVRDGSNQSVVLTDKTFPGKEFTLKLDIYEEYEQNLVVFFRTVTEDWYLFSRSLHDFAEGDDFGLFTESVSVHSNLTGGLGVFCAGAELEVEVVE